MKKKINLMLATDFHGKGGIASVVLNYRKNLLLKKINSKVIVTHKSNAGKFKLIIIFIIALMKVIFYSFNFKVNIAHIHVASNFSFLRKSMLIFICNLFSIRVFAHLHGGNFDLFYKNSNSFYKKFITFVFNKTDKIIVLSPYYKDFIKKICFKKDIYIIPNSIENNKKIKNLKNYNKKRYILFLGNLEKRKGVQDIFKIINQLKNKDKDIKFIFCGFDKDSYFKNLSKKMKINDKIDFISWINGKKKEKILSQTKILLLPSYNENLPISILEAMYNQIPVISTNVGGIPYQIKHNYSGYLIKPGDTKKLVTYINKLVSNNKMCKQFGLRAKKTFMKKFSNQVVFKKITDLYDS